MHADRYLFLKNEFVDGVQTLLCIAAPGSHESPLILDQLLLRELHSSLDILIDWNNTHSRQFMRQCM